MAGFQLYLGKGHWTMKPKTFICLLNLLSKIVPAGSLESFLGKVRGRGGGWYSPLNVCAHVNRSMISMAL